MDRTCRTHGTQDAYVRSYGKKRKGKRTSSHKLENNIKINFNDIGLKSMSRLYLVQNRDQRRDFVNRFTNLPCSIKCC
jgi:hypothetical protein